MTSMHVRLPFGSRAAGAARRLVDDYLVEASVSSSTREDAALVVHELVTNGVRHGSPVAAGGLGLTYGITGRNLQLTVVDGGGAGTVAALERDDHSLSGRGLAIVDALAAEWSVDRTDGTAVSARLRLTP